MINFRKKKSKIFHGYLDKKYFHGGFFNMFFFFLNISLEIMTNEILYYVCLYRFSNQLRDIYRNG